MAKYEDVGLDLVFGALSHPARRGTIDALAGGARSVSELTTPHGMSLVGFMKHVRVLEEARLIACEKEGRIVRYVLTPARIRKAAIWLARYERFWDARLDALGRHLYHQKEMAHGQKRRSRQAPQHLAASIGGCVQSIHPNRSRFAVRLN